ncbi:hypothetical protein PR048_031580 [Dryococelus australis]|uniref:DDE Tnp4 domain-containing protein n=1 Tax=Dryococelus australis TaxID=614101 RepID=A0ABQ9G8H5_9NEOP|nr:hypothetical protein PR048_031580 [Dryococelus australis]
MEHLASDEETFWTMALEGQWGRGANNRRCALVMGWGLGRGCGALCRQGRAHHTSVPRQSSEGEHRSPTNTSTSTPHLSPTQSSKGEGVLVLLPTPKRKKENQNVAPSSKKEWVNTIHVKREELGEFNHMWDDLSKDPKRFYGYLRMTRDTFDYILSEVRRALTKYNNFRKTISPEERLVITLRRIWRVCECTCTGVFTVWFVEHFWMLPFKSLQDIVAFKNSNILKYGHLLTCSEFASRPDFAVVTFSSFRPNVSLIPLHFFFRSSTETNDSLCFRYLATISSFKTLGFSCRIADNTIGNIIHDTCKVLWEHLHDTHMKFPTNKDITSIANDFWAKWGFPNCSGSIDGKHIRIKTPPHSVLQAVVYANYRFIAIYVGAYGKESDGSIFSHSDLCKLLDNGLFNSVKPYLMRPYPQGNLSPEEDIFNKNLTRTRQVVECAFGIMSAKWRLLLKMIDVHPDPTDDIVKCVCLLHNFIIDKEGINDWAQQTVITRNVGANVGEKRGATRAHAIRDTLKACFVSHAMLTNSVLKQQPINKDTACTVSEHIGDVSERVCRVASRKERYSVAGCGAARGRIRGPFVAGNPAWRTGLPADGVCDTSSRLVRPGQMRVKQGEYGAAPERKTVKRGRNRISPRKPIEQLHRPP